MKRTRIESVGGPEKGATVASVHSVAMEMTTSQEEQKEKAGFAHLQKSRGFQSPPKASTASYGNEGMSGDTVFKRAFKAFKKRQPPPDFSKVLDLRSVTPNAAFTRRPFEATLSVDEELVRRSGLRPPADWTISELVGRKGLYVISDVLREDVHLDWLRTTLEWANAPNNCNLALHASEPIRDVLSSRESLRKLRWTTLGVQYNWTTKEYPSDGLEMPQKLKDVGHVVTTALGLPVMRADAAIVNYYPDDRATLSPHVDKSERDLSRALVSLSLGQSAIYLTGGRDLNDPVEALWLRGGDVLVMEGEQRLVYHAIPRIAKTCDFKGEDPALVDYANKARVNITIRQVNFLSG